MREEQKEAGVRVNQRAVGKFTVNQLQSSEGTHWGAGHWSA